LILSKSECNGPLPKLELFGKPKPAPAPLKPVVVDVETSVVWVSNLDIEMNVDPVKVVVNKKNDERVSAL
jgi:hypothetical protein